MTCKEVAESCKVGIFKSIEHIPQTKGLLYNAGLIIKSSYDAATGGEQEEGEGRVVVIAGFLLAMRLLLLVAVYKNEQCVYLRDREKGDTRADIWLWWSILDRG